MRKKLFYIIVGITITTGILYFIFRNEFQNSFYKTFITNENHEEFLQSSNDFNDFPIHYKFLGDNNNTYFVKGKLLDNSVKNDYNNLPDSLTDIQYGEILYCMDCSEKYNSTNGSEDKKTYSPLSENGNAQNYLIQNNTNPNKLNLYKYLKLADEGKVEYPIIKYKNYQSHVIVEETSYDRKFDMFNRLYLSDIPYRAKVKIVEFLNTDQGSKYNFDNGQKDTRTHLYIGNLTQKPEQDIAIVLKYSDESGLENQYKLLIYSYSYYKNDYYLLYNQTYWDAVNIEELFKFREGELNKPQIYMNTENMVDSPFPPLLITQHGKPNIALVYNQEFDKMVEYEQISLFEINERRTEEYYDEY